MSAAPRRRLNDHRFCVCAHGQGAHRNGTGKCVGEKRFKGSWVSCACEVFVYQPETPAPDAEKTAGRDSANAVNTESISE